jgi:hypothetical protein
MLQDTPEILGPGSLHSERGQIAIGMRSPKRGRIREDDHGDMYPKGHINRTIEDSGKGRRPSYRAVGEVSRGMTGNVQIR